MEALLLLDAAIRGIEAMAAAASMMGLM